MYLNEPLAENLKDQIVSRPHIVLVLLIDFILEVLHKSNGIFIANSLLLFINHDTIQAKFWSDDLEMPSKVIFTNHHSHLNPIELFTQFFFQNQFENFTVLTTSKNIFNLTGFLYCQKSFDTSNREDRHWSLTKLLLKESSAISVFPDRDGRQFEGDREFWFRTGAYATSIYWQAPIIDCIIQSHNKKLYVFFYKYEPPKIESQCCEASDSYALWRQQNYALIEEYTLFCEREYKKNLDYIESNFQGPEDTGTECLIKMDKFRRRQWNWNSYCEN